MRALVVAPQPFFSPRGTPLSVYYRTLVMSEKGMEIDLLTYGEGQDVELPGLRIVRIPRFGFLGPVPIGPSLRKAFLDLVLGCYLVALLVANRYDRVHAHEEAIFPCVALKRLFGFKLIYDMHSSLPQQLTNFGFTNSRLLIGAFSWLERQSLRGADVVITICPGLAEFALREIDDPRKHFLIENSIFEPVRLVDPTGRADGSAHGPDALEGLLPEHPCDPLIVYAGTLEPYQGIELLMRAFAVTVPQLREGFLLLVGGTQEQVARFRALAGELGIAPQTRFTGSVPPQTARACAARADLLVSPRIEGTNTPLKVYEQLASGIPLVATNIYAHTQVLDDEVAFLADPMPEAFAKALLRGATDVAAREAKVRRARALYETAYSRSAYAAKIDALLERIA